MASPFLTAQWRHLVMLNWEVDPALLRDRVPYGTELDSFAGRTYVSLVGFLFLDTRVLGFPIPWHVDFEEVNLRFYVRRRHFGQERRGVVFLKEIVPLWAVATIANWLYGENYVALPMRHTIDLAEPASPAGTAPDAHASPADAPPGGASDAASASAPPAASDPLPRRLSYEWQYGGAWYRVAAATTGVARPAAEGSLEQYITEHYWGYAAAGPTASTEYEVTHPPWNLWACSSATFEGDAGALYGPAWGPLLAQPPASAFVCDGSAITVAPGRRLGG